jgi:uncharacterized membrane protein
MLPRSLGVIVAIVIAVASAAAILAGLNNQVLRVVFGLALALVVPGYTLTAAIFAPRTLKLSERFCYAVGLSLAIDILGGFALHWTPWGLQTVSWAVLLASVSLVAGLVGLGRQQFTSAVTDISWPTIKLGVAPAILFGLTILVILGAINVAQAGANQPRTTFTQLWLLPAESDTQPAVQLGIRSMELAPVRYRLQVEVIGQIVLDEQAIELQPGEQWDTRVALPIQYHNGQLVEAILYRLDNPTQVYRRVALQRPAQEKE